MESLLFPPHPPLADFVNSRRPHLQAPRVGPRPPVHSLVSFYAPSRVERLFFHCHRHVHTRNLHPSMYTSISNRPCRRGSGVATHAVSTATIDEGRTVFGNVSVGPIAAFRIVERYARY